MTDTPQLLGRYELLNRIAKGGMGEIFLAKARGAGGFEKNVILKTILPHLAEEEEFITKFLDEGRIVVQLIHGNIVPVFDMGEQDGVYFIAMEYVPGRDLREVIKRLDVDRKRLPVDLALFIGSEIAKGLDYAHRKTDETGESLGIIHRDISPSNVLISSDGEVKLIDFGIARAAGRLSKTVSGRIQGKFCYMSPEQASGRPLDPRSDVFSAGTTIYEMLTGLRPFEGSTDLESLDLVRRCEFDPPSTLNAEIPEEVDAIIARALAKSPDERYPTAEKLQVDILQYLYSTGSSPTSGEVAKFLQSLFPEGLERQELKSARGSGSGSKNRKLSLDDALELELEKVMGDIDPHSTTAMNSTPTPSTRTGIAIGPPSKAGGLPDSNGGGLPDSNGRGLPDGTSPSITPSNAMPMTDEVSRGSLRWVVLLVGLVGATLAFMYFSRTEPGVLVLNSAPPGARVIIDGAEAMGIVTPAKLDLTEGVHVVSLEKDGFVGKTLRIQIRPEEVTTVDAEAATLEQIRGPRRFELVAPDAQILRDQQVLGISPQTVSLLPNQVTNVRAMKEGCTSSNYTLSYDHGEDTIRLPLECPDPTTAVEPQVDRVTEHTNNATMLTLGFDSEPAGARVVVDGKQVGITPWSGSYRGDQTLAIRFEKDGFAPVEMRQKVSSWKGRKVSATLSPSESGCLDISLVNPAVGEIAIDGGPFREVSRGVRGWSVAAGKHEVRVRNLTAKRDDTFKVDVQAGKACSLIVWE